MPISELVIHAEYFDAHVGDDICLLHLSKPLHFNDNVDSIELQEVDAPVGESCTISGWGTLYVSVNKHRAIQSMVTWDLDWVGEIRLRSPGLSWLSLPCSHSDTVW